MLVFLRTTVQHVDRITAMQVGPRGTTLGAHLG